MVMMVMMTVMIMMMMTMTMITVVNDGPLLMITNKNWEKNQDYSTTTSIHPFIKFLKMFQLVTHHNWVIVIMQK